MLGNRSKVAVVVAPPLLLLTGQVAAACSGRLSKLQPRQ